MVFTLSLVLLLSVLAAAGGAFVLTRRLVAPLEALVAGTEAVAAVARLRPDILFLDVQMPDCDGIECLRDLRSRGCTVPVVIFTSLNDPERRRQAQEAGADDYVLKHQLLDRLPDLLERLLPKRTENRHP